MAATFPHLYDIVDGVRSNGFGPGLESWLPIAIIGGRPHCHNGVIEHWLVSLHDKLMCPCNQLQSIGMQELEVKYASLVSYIAGEKGIATYFLDNITTEKVSRSSWTIAPSINIYSWRPIIPLSLGRHCKLFNQLPSGSDHSRSHIAPSWGTSCLRSIVRIYRKKAYLSQLLTMHPFNHTWSKVLILGDSPPWTHNILSSIIALRLRQSNTSQQNLQTLDEPYLRRHSS